MANQTKVKQFFDGRRREARLLLYTHLKTKAEENRFKLSLSIPLLNQSVVSMPKAVSDVFSVMAKDDSDLSRAKLAVFLEGMTLELFATDTQKGAPSLSITGCTFKSLQLVAAGVAEKRTIDLEMMAYVPASLALHDWVYPQLHGTFFLEAVYSQSEMDFSDIPDEDEDAEEEEAPEEKSAPAARPSRPVKKSGPKDLAAEHAKHVQ
jgi:hypothetical protein